MGKKKPLQEHIEDFNKVHNNKYDYSELEWKNTNTKIEIICPEHGSFFQNPANHKRGVGCPKCKNKGLTNSEWIERFNKVHNNKYDYSKINYVKYNTKIEIICPEHGSFFQRPDSHLYGSGCPKCGKTTLLKNNVLIDFNNIHNNKYDYSEVNYINSSTKVQIICPEHGSFYQEPHNHKKGSGCPRCKSSKGENYIRNYLLENSFSVLEQYSFRDSSIKNLRFDFYLEDYNLAIEYDGIQHFEAIEHFGGEEALASCKERDEIKNMYCFNNNINLLRIPYWEFDNIEKLIQEKIEYIYIKETEGKR
jgi:Zn finger protein HypA/HybF involved in hydrogenase expression